MPKRGKVANRYVQEMVPLITPDDLLARQPLDPAARDVVLAARQAIRRIIHGQDRRRLVVVIGPCSIHDPAAAFDYAQRLKPVADAARDELLIVMRTYFEKPRTTVGWKGLINDPFLDGSCDISTGLERARALLLRVNALGVPCASEVLDPITPQYIADLLSWSVIGARTTESQTHREMASGLSMPVGFKNGTDGSLDVALNAMTSARQPHSFLGINSQGLTSIVRTLGNPDRHIVLRGGNGQPNYSPEEIQRAAELAAGQSIARPIMVDCSHGNANKDHRQQGHVCREVLRQFREGQRAIMGLMLESNLYPGRQDWRPGAHLEHGVSITDACIGWEETEGLLQEMATAVRTARPRRRMTHAPALACRA